MNSSDRVLRRISVAKGEEVVEGLRTLHNEELHKLNASPNINKVMESRRVRWVEYVVLMKR
jgi:hypothetical protein